MDQEGIHSSRFFLEPAVWVEAVAILTEQVGVPVNDPRIYAKNCLKFLDSWNKTLSSPREGSGEKSYPFREMSAGDCNPTSRRDPWKTKSNSGVKPVCLFHLFDGLRITCFKGGEFFKNTQA
jgi:hypothetical protein